MSLKVYYLDDEPDLCENLADILSSPEVTVETFQDAASLVSRCEKFKPDLIFLDYRLPGTTGDEVAQKLEPSIPKILITGDIHVQTNYQFVAVLPKPTQIKHLHAAIEHAKEVRSKTT
jgi:FixJ family two-component response regulator